MILDTEVSDDTLDRTPEKALALLRAAGTSSAIFTSLSAYGYSKKFHQEGWDLLHAASSFTDDGAWSEEENSDVRDAMLALDAEDEPLFRIIHASLRRRFPEQERFLLGGLATATGAGAVLVVKSIVERFERVAAETDKKDARDALALLATRGINSDKLTSLKKLIRVAESANAGSTIDRSAEDERAASQAKALRDLRAWYEEWSEIAHVAVRRRDHLIRLGLASRRKAKSDEGDITPPAAAKEESAAG